MAYPDVSTLIDDFNRADANGGSTAGVAVGAGASIWDTTLPVWGGAAHPLGISSNQAYSVGGSDDSLLLGTYGDCEFQVDVAVAPGSGGYVAIFFRGGNVTDPSTWQADWLIIDDTGGWSFHQHVSGSSSTLNSASGTTLSAGDKVGIKASGTALSAYHYTSGSWNQTPIVTATDSTLTSGRMSLELGDTTVRVDNLSGGSLTTGDATVTAPAAIGTGDIPAPVGWEDIPSATSSTYSPVTGDIGCELRVIVTATNAQGSAAATSSPTSAVTSGSGDATVTAAIQDGTGQAAAPTVQASSTVTSALLDGTGDMVAPADVFSAEVDPGPQSGTGDIPTPTVSGTGSSTVTAVIMDGTGDVVAPVVTGTGSAQVIVPPIDGTGDLVTPVLHAGATIISPVADGAGDITAPAVTAGGPRTRLGLDNTGALEVNARTTGGIDVRHLTGGLEPAHTTGGDEVFNLTGGLEVALVP